jgi:hypothetical protein
MNKQSVLQTVEIYDSFRPEVLLEIRFQRGDVPLLKTNRSSYFSIRQIYEGSLTRLVQPELPLSYKPKEKETTEAETVFWERAHSC